jgi:AcrR family transcriptional regulator
MADQTHSRSQVATLDERPENEEDRLLDAYRAAAEHVFGEIRPTVGASDWSDAVRGALRGPLGVLQNDPSAVRLLFVEGPGGGQRVRREIARALGEFERHVQAFLDSPPKNGSTLDIPAIAVLGALRNVVSSYLRTHAEDRLPPLVEDGLAWVKSYAIPTGQARWSTGPNALLAAAPPAPAGLVAHSQRERLLQGTAEVMMAKGYANATVADIVAQAGVSKDVFREHFTSKQHAFLEAQQYPTQYVLDTCSTAYFSAREWPERIWNGVRALLGLIVADPAIAHLRLVECYAAGPAAIRRAEEITRSFTFFLEEGYSYRPQNHELPRLYSEAIVGAIFEIIQRNVAHGETARLPRHLPQIVYIVIAPFTGPEEAIRLLEQFSAQ